MRPAVLMLALTLLTGCRYTFIPLVPTKTQGTFPTRLGATAIVRAGDDLRLAVTLDDQKARGYLSVVWYRDTTEIGRNSVYLDAGGRRASFVQRAPERASGYRAVLTFESEVLRQLEYSDPPAPAAK